MSSNVQMGKVQVRSYAGTRAEDHTESVGLIAAMPQESKALLRYIKRSERTKLGPFQGTRFHLMNRECLLITTGMGLKRAVAGTRAILAAASPRLLVSFGIAGAVQDDLRIGDVVVAGNTCLLDKGLPREPRPLASLSKAAWDSAIQVLQTDGARLEAGMAITTAGSQTVPQSLEKVPHLVLEMETTSIAQVAAEMGIPLVSIRSISDGPQAPLPFDLEAVLDENDNLLIGKMLIMVLRNPRIISQSRQMMKNSGIAADHAAKAVFATLSQPSPILSL